MKDEVCKFEKLYNATDDEIKKEEFPIVVSNTKKKWEIALNDANRKILTLKREITEEMRKGETMDVNRVIEFDFNIEKLERQKKVLIKYYLEYFGEDLK